MEFFLIPTGIRNKGQIKYILSQGYIGTTSLLHYLGGNNTKTITQELKQYITHPFQLSNNEAGGCEALEGVAEGILPERFTNDSLLIHLILGTYTYYNDELHELSIHPFLMYVNNQLISIGCLDHFDMDLPYLTDTQNIVIDERHLLEQGGQDHE